MHKGAHKETRPRTKALNASSLKHVISNQTKLIGWKIKPSNQIGFCLELYWSNCSMYKFNPLMVLDILLYVWYGIFLQLAKLKEKMVRNNKKILEKYKCIHKLKGRTFWWEVKLGLNLRRIKTTRELLETGSYFRTTVKWRARHLNWHSTQSLKVTSYAGCL